MEEVCRATFCLPIVYVTMNFGSAEYPVGDQSRKQDGSETSAESHRPDLVIEEHESKDQCGRIERGRREHQSKRRTKPRGTLVHASEDRRDTTRAQHQWRSRQSIEY